ncbi:MAG: winged helix-turn-helix domain-containing protein [bacterium]
MLEPLLGSTNAERVLIFIYSRDEGYVREIARFFNSDPDSIQKQLKRLEAGGVLVSKTAGKTRLYSFNPRYPFLRELRMLLEKALQFYTDEEREKLLMNRRRPRRGGKPYEID